MIKALTVLSNLIDKMSAHAESKKLDHLPKEKNEDTLLNDRPLLRPIPFRTPGPARM